MNWKQNMDSYFLFCKGYMSHVNKGIGFTCSFMWNRNSINVWNKLKENDDMHKLSKKIDCAELHIEICLQST